MGVFLFVLEQYEMWSLHYTMNVGLMVVFSTIIFVAVSLMTDPPAPEKIELLTYRKGLISEGTEGEVWYKDYRYQIAVLVALIGYILFVFW